MTIKKITQETFFPNLYTGAQIALPKRWDLREKVKGENPFVGT